MLELMSLDNLNLVLGFLVPGIVVLFVRSQFVTRRSYSQSAMLLSYFTVSVVYLVLALPFVDFGSLTREPFHANPLRWFALTVAGPAALGFVLGVNIQKNLFRRFLQLFGLNPIHSILTAWDWKFVNLTSQWVLVTLKDGTRFAGFCGPNSFVSSDPAERDIYIQWIYDIQEDGTWISRGEKGVLITAGEIQTIEFWPKTPREISDDEQE